MQIAANYGARPVTADRLRTNRIRTEEVGISRAELAKDAKAAAVALNLRPALRLVLNELVGVYGERPIADRLMVWPSNEFLVERTGLSERAVRYALQKLIRQDLIAARDSANGKRFAIRNKSALLVDAYGFDLGVLHRRRQEFDQKVQERHENAQILRKRSDLVTRSKRMVQGALQELASAFPDVSSVIIRERYEKLSGELPRRSNFGVSLEFTEAWQKLADLAEETLFNAGYGGNSCRHIETDNDSDPDCEVAREATNGGDALPDLSLVQDACPAVIAYGGRNDSWEGLISSARYLRPSLGAHESAWNEAVAALGSAKAAVVLAVVLQLYEDDDLTGSQTIKNPGGYFRAMCRLVDEHRVKLDVELRRLLKRKTGSQ